MTRTSFGRPRLKDPKDRHLATYVTNTTYARVTRMAESSGFTRSTVIRIILEKVLGRLDEDSMLSGQLDRV